MATRNLEFSQFYCTQCGKRGFDIPRTNGKAREAGHLKEIYCLTCKKRTNFVEVKPFTKYDYEDFLLEFKNNNFTKEGTRKIPYNKLKGRIHNGK